MKRLMKLYMQLPSESQFPSNGRKYLDYGLQYGINKEYDNYDMLNWRDDAKSYNDWPNTLNGYSIDPYGQFSEEKTMAMKKANYADSIEIDYTPFGQAKTFLRLWNQLGGPVQQFFEQFTYKFSNDEKIAIANQLKNLGYNVTPTLLDETPRYAMKRLKKKEV